MLKLIHDILIFFYNCIFRSCNLRNVSWNKILDITEQYISKVYKRLFVNMLNYISHRTLFSEIQKIRFNNSNLWLQLIVVEGFGPKFYLSFRWLTLESWKQNVIEEMMWPDGL